MESARCYPENPAVGDTEERAHVKTARTAGTVLVHLGSGSELAGGPRAAVITCHASTSQDE